MRFVQGRLVLTGLACLLLTACAGGTPDAGGDESTGAKRQAGFLSALRAAAPDTKSAATPLQSADLARGAIVVKGPEGYCIEPSSLSRKQGGFALLASCRIMTGGKGGNAVTPALLTVSVGPALSGLGAPNAADLAQALSEMQVIAASDVDGMALVQLGRGGDSIFDDGDPVHWRGALVVNSRLVGLAAYGPNGGEIAKAKGAALLTALAKSIRNASPERTATRTKRASVSDTNAGKPRKGLRGALQSLFN